ncbi:dihydrolipoyllysine-residue acetyltransferase component of pyruvate dehydrogenase complex, mitochondrial-like [Pollicipes pollicipes]|uniref:dihydrolipoyllysine-residue acetyltransferase component of pyruvate dehydrogenase complex, mitochondrial-like n=1 Tax=Pollicipes pollicipes TaxID=41117 RepID=UPI00188598D1|nr:dihydrolipoyllysine-residue acetyltransferase component of pyruvate dehydrogenase complex, mitochondrial-like [Pollicipes pollicipes]XP_037070651.1 dihydrolipoyllysine-residue acetyltransferase component of pyruvate dehydrogenase complex, mitochondrial-like [Pollicipes pollicipes]
MLLRPAVPFSRALCRQTRLRHQLGRACAASFQTRALADALRPPGATLCARALPRPPTWARRYSSQDLPAHHKIVLPALSPTMESGSIISWEKAEGDHVAEGDLLAEIETDKASMGFENSDEGYLAKILVPAGTKDIPLGKLLCIIVDNKEDIDKFKDYVDTSGPAPPSAPSPPQEKAAAPAAAPAPPPPAAAAASPAAVPAPSAGPPTGRIMASPRARRLAAEQGVDLASLRPGSDGLVRAAQVTAAPAAAPVSAAAQPSAAHDDLELSAMRKTIAKRLLQSKQTIPHYYLSATIDMTHVTRVRAEANQRAGKDGVRLSINDFVIKAAALACAKVPAVNSSWMDTFIRQYRSVDVSVAVSTEQGLITPIVFGAEARGVADISAEVRRLAERARARQLQPREYQGGTFSISNLGMFGVKNFAAIVNPPQACILAVGGVEQKLVPGEAGPRTIDAMAVTLSCDHRVVDGAVGAQWLAVFRGLLEQPVTMIL